MASRASSMAATMAVVVGVPALAGDGLNYAALDLGFLQPTPTSTRPFAISDSGVVVGDTLTGQLTLRAFRSDGDGLIDLGQSPAALSRAFAISGRGVSAGWHDDPTGSKRAALWVGERVEFLPMPDGFGESEVRGLNSANLAVGAVFTVVGDFEPYAWVQDGDGVRGVPLGGPFGIAFDVNHSGCVVGQQFSSGSFRAAMWTDVPDEPSQTILPDLGAGDAAARAVSDAGVIAGDAESPVTGLKHAVRWDDGEPTDLGPFEGLPTGGLGVNAEGAVVGVAGSGETARAMLWTPAGEAHDLNELIPAASDWTLRIAQDLNGAGQIVGWGVRDGLDGERGFVLTPIPNPSCNEDLSGDGVVDSADLNALLAAFGVVGSQAGDVDGDGDTDSADLNQLLAVFGEPCG